jgi:hypothetical protein
MTISPAEIVRKYLIDQSTVVMGGTSGGWPSYYANKPENPDNLVAVYNTAPFIDGRVHNSGEVDEHAGIQVLIRGTDDRIAWAKGFDIQEKLRTIKRTTVIMPPETLGGLSVRYMLWSFHRTQSLMFVGEEEKNRRRLYTVNGFLAVSVLPPPPAPAPVSGTIVTDHSCSVTFDRAVTATLGGVTLDNVRAGATTPTAVSGSGTTTLTYTTGADYFQSGDVAFLSTYSGSFITGYPDGVPVADFGDFVLDNPL